MIAWHITGSTLRDGRPLLAIGETLRHDGPVAPCKSGLHASVRLVDALGHAPDDACWLHRVEVGGEIVDHGDNVASSERTILESWPLRIEDLRVLAGECAALACWSAGLTGEVHQSAAAATTAYRLGECGPGLLCERWDAVARDPAVARGIWSAATAAMAARGVGDAARDVWSAATAAWSAAMVAWNATTVRAAGAARDACEARAVALLAGEKVAK